MKGSAWKAVGLIGLVAILAALMVAGGSLLRLAIAVPLVLLLPGYALTGPLFHRQRLGRFEKLLFMLSLSLITAALGGFVLHWTPGGLQVWRWTALLAGITLVAAYLALRKRARKPFALALRPKPGLYKQFEELSLCKQFQELPMTSHALLFGLAAFIVVAAMAVAREGALKHLAAPVTQLWILPLASEEASDEGAFELGVANLESETVEFRLRLEVVQAVPGTAVSNRLLREMPAIRLEPNQTWKMTLLLPPDLPTPATITARLYREDAPDAVYRQVVWRPRG